MTRSSYLGSQVCSWSFVSVRVECVCVYLVWQCVCRCVWEWVVCVLSPVLFFFFYY